MTDTATDAAETPESPARGVSPYAAGGGGVTLERRVAAVYLARLITGSTAGELGERRVQRVGFQQAPAHPVDDLVIIATRDDGTDPLELSIAVRRAPALITSEKDTEKLFGRLIAELRRRPPAGVEKRSAICVAGPQRAAQQVRQLAAIAHDQTTAAGFVDLVRTPGRFERAVVDRLGHLVNLVAANLPAEGADATPAAAELVTWQLLARLDVLMLRLESPDETDWDDLLNTLEPWAREPTAGAAAALRDRLEALAAAYMPVAADVDLAMIRRDAHEVLHVERRRREVAWAELRRLDAEARHAVRHTVGVDATGEGLHLPRPRPASAIRQELCPGPPVLLSGESGVGKSALVLDELAPAAAADLADNDAVFLNLRQLPRTMVELRHALGAPLDDLLGELSAPTRVLVLDGADVVIERDDQILEPLLRAAIAADVTPLVICATDGRAAVHAVMQNVAGSVRQVAVEGLDDAELDDVVRAFPQLRRLVDVPRAKELLRRPAVVDLFVRSGSTGLPLSEADALDIVWTNLVRNAERTIRGLPDARDQVMCQLAMQQLRRTDAATTSSSLDPAAVAGLQHDVLLRRADRWQTLPTFAHDLLRTYAVARVLLSFDDPVAELIARDAPRWALPAARLAIQVLLAAPDNPDSSLAGRFARVQAAVDRLAEAGHGSRWADLPTEALLTLPNAKDILADAWPALVDGEAAGLRRLLRVIQQRYGGTGIIDRLIAEPVVELLLEHDWPSDLHNQVNELLSGWLRGVLLAREPAGHPLRVRLRERLVARVAAGDERLADNRREQAERLAARTPEEVTADEEHARRWRPLTAHFIDGHRSRRPYRELPRELTEDALLTQLALLGADLGSAGETLLRRVATDGPQHLAPTVEEAFTDFSLASYNTSLLIELVEAYYVDDRGDDGFSRMHNYGIRKHRFRGLFTPHAAYYRGPFLVLFRTNLRAGVACLNRLLNHAAHARVQVLRRPSWDADPRPEDGYVTELDITGERRRYVGDAHVWIWYRGTGVGPYPCMSALQALERVCDEYLQAGTPPAVLVRLLLEGCENLAMPALVVGMLVRHLEKVDTELDPFLAEPAIWHLEFARLPNEYSGLAARTDGIVAPERRNWTPGDVSMQLVLAASAERRDALRTVGRRLVALATELEGTDADSEELSEELARVRRWAGSLDIDSYSFTPTEEGIRIEQVVDSDVEARLAPTNTDLARGNNVIRIMNRYPYRFDHLAKRSEVTRRDLLADLAVARDLIDNPPILVPFGASAAPAAVAAAALEARFIDGLDVPDDDLAWSARLLVELMNAFADQGASDEDYSIFGKGPDRAAARALPLLTLPAASTLRDRLADDGIGPEAVTKAMSWIVEHAANETRLFLARGFDALWQTECDTTSGACHHPTALAVIEDTARDCLIGPWDPAPQRNGRLHIDGPVAIQLEAAEHDHVDVPRLNAAIRGAAAAASSTACCRADASTLLAAALAAHRAGMRASEYGDQHSDNDAAVAARAVLDIAATGDRTLLFTHIDGYADHPRLLSEFLHALVAAGEETQTRAAAARQAWPAVLDHIIKLVTSGTCPRDDHQYGYTPLAAAIPTPSYASGYLHREYEGAPIPWPDPIALAPQIEQWLPIAAGHRETIDALAQLLDRLPAERQARIGLAWMEQLVMANPAVIANRSFMLPNWLQRVEPHATSEPLRTAWHRIVDALTVAGDDRVAALAD